MDIFSGSIFDSYVLHLTGSLSFTFYKTYLVGKA